MLTATLLILSLVEAASIESSPPLEKKLLSDGVASMSPESAVLVASGAATNAELSRQRKLLTQTIARMVSRAAKVKGDDRAKADALLAAMYTAGPLKRYVAGVSDLGVTLTSGDYNCLTSTALYVLAARKLGLHVGAYAMEGHILALAYLSSGPYYVETTDPEGGSRYWSTPFYVYGETLVRERQTRQAQERQLMQEAAAHQLFGEDDASESKLAVVDRSMQDAFEIAERASERIVDTAHEVDLPGLASMFFWNRAIEAILDDNASRQLRMQRAYLTTAAQSDSESSFSVRFLELQQVLRVIAETKGWREAKRILNALLDSTDDPRERAGLRDLRARLWAAAAAGAKGAEQCEPIRDAKKTDADHPLVSALVASASHCGL